MITSVLTSSLPFGTAKTHWSYVSRLAALRTGRAPASFLRDLGIDARPSRWPRAGGAQACRRRVCQLACFPPQCDPTAPERPLLLVPWRSPVSGLRRRQRRPPRSSDRACQAGRRPPWGVRPRPSDGTLRAGCGGGTLRPRVERALTPLEQWLRHGLCGRADDGGSWLAGQTLEQGTRACEMPGLVLLRGVAPNVRDPCPRRPGGGGARGLRCRARVRKPYARLSTASTARRGRRPARRDRWRGTVDFPGGSTRPRRWWTMDLFVRRCASTSWTTWWSSLESPRSARSSRSYGCTRSRCYPRPYPWTPRSREMLSLSGAWCAQGCPRRLWSHHAADPRGRTDLPRPPRRHASPRCGDRVGWACGVG